MAQEYTTTKEVVASITTRWAVRDRGALYAAEEFRGEGEREMIKAQLCVELMERYKYPEQDIRLRHLARVDIEGTTVYTEADIVVLKKGVPFMVVEVVLPKDFEGSLGVGVSRLFRLAPALNAGYGGVRFLLYYTRAYVQGRPAEKFLTIDWKKFQTFEAWHKAGRPHEGYIP